MGNIETTEEYHQRVRQERIQEYRRSTITEKKHHPQKQKIRVEPREPREPKELREPKDREYKEVKLPQKTHISNSIYQHPTSMQQTMQQTTSTQQTMQPTMQQTMQQYIKPINKVVLKDAYLENEREQEHGQEHGREQEHGRGQELMAVYDFGGINALNINDKIKDYEKFDNENRKKFEEDQKERERIFNENRKKNKSLFEKEIELFEKGNDDPYKILGIEQKNISIEKIKKAYKLKARKHHPDKGGDEVMFKKITQSYCYLISKYEQMHDSTHNAKISKPVSKKEYNGNVNDGYENIFVSKDNFNINKFNETFDKFKLDNPYDDGYGGIMEKSEYIKDRSIFDNNEFNKKIFSQLDDEDNMNDDKNELITYNEPIALPSSSGAYQELGRGKITDFGGNNFTDYRRAYDKNSKFIEPDKVQYKQYKSLNDLKADRERIQPLSGDELEKIQQREMFEKNNEEIRLRRLKEEEDRYNQQFNQLNRRMLGQKR